MNELLWCLCPRLLLFLSYFRIVVSSHTFFPFPQMHNPSFSSYVHTVIVIVSCSDGLLFHLQFSSFSLTVLVFHD
jgi:hypothetical protein